VYASISAGLMGCLSDGVVERKIILKLRSRTLLQDCAYASGTFGFNCGIRVEFAPDGFLESPFDLRGRLVRIAGGVWADWESIVLAFFCVSRF
jgi:hypothetical protein